MATVDKQIEECRAEVDAALADLHQRIASFESVQELLRDIYASTKHADERLSNLMISFASYTAKQDLIANGFPDGDPDGHRKAHELFIQQAKAKAIFWEAMKTEATKWGILGVLGFIAASVWLAVKAEMHK